MPTKFKPGEIIDKVYMVEEAFTGGSFGHAYKIKNGTGYEVIKICAEPAGTTEALRFVQENDFLYKLFPNPAIIEPLSKISPLNPDSIYYRMKFADYNLETYLDDFESSLDLNSKLSIFKGICEGLKHAHANKILHRDLHWGNILIDMLNNMPVPKLTDFGRSKDLKALIALSSNPGIWGEFVCPPEIRFRIWDKLPTNYMEGDIYSLGIIFYYILGAMPNFPFIFQNEIINFLRNKKVTLKTVNDESIRHGLYKEWLGTLTDQKINSHLSILINGSAVINDKINTILKKLSHPNYELRYRSVEDVLKEIATL